MTDRSPRSYPVDGFWKLCSISANLGHLPPKEEQSLGHGTYYKVNFSVVLNLNATELKAQVAWDENGEERR